MVNHVRFKTEIFWYLFFFSWKMYLTTSLRTWWRVKMESKKLLRWDVRCIMCVCKEVMVAGCCLTCEMTSLLSTGCRDASPAPPEAGAVVDVCSWKQKLVAALLGEERRSLLQQPHMFLYQRNTWESLWWNTGGWHGAGEYFERTLLSCLNKLIEYKCDDFTRERLWPPLLSSSPTFTVESLCLWWHL